MGVTARPSASRGQAEVDHAGQRFRPPRASRNPVAGANLTFAARRQSQHEKQPTAAQNQATGKA